jgi:hypothetical protein
MEWINAQDKNPPKDRGFLAVLVNGKIRQRDICFWNKEKGAFIDYYYNHDVTKTIHFWMELPPFP